MLLIRIFNLILKTFIKTNRLAVIKIYLIINQIIHKTYKFLKPNNNFNNNSNLIFQSNLLIKFIINNNQFSNLNNYKILSISNNNYKILNINNNNYKILSINNNNCNNPNNKYNRNNNSFSNQMIDKSLKTLKRLFPITKYNTSILPTTTTATTTRKKLMIQVSSKILLK